MTGSETSYLIDSLDIGALSAAIRSHTPTLTSAFVVGSCVNRPADLVRDIDVTAFDSRLNISDQQTFSLQFAHYPVHVVCYHPAYFDAMANDDILTLLFLREIRKLRRGRMVLDKDGEGVALLKRLQLVKLSLNLIESQYRAIENWEFPVSLRDEGDRAASNLHQRLDFYRLVENAVFYLLHVDERLTYSKPKWVMHDVAQSGAKGVERLVCAVSEEYVEQGVLPRAAELLRRVVPQVLEGPALPENLQSHVHAMESDTLQLLAKGEFAAASWPLRMAVLMIGRCIALIRDIPYEDARSLGQTVDASSPSYPAFDEMVKLSMLADVPIDLGFAVLWDEAKRDLSNLRGAALSARLSVLGEDPSGRS